MKKTSEDFFIAAISPLDQGKGNAVLCFKSFVVAFCFLVCEKNRLQGLFRPSQPGFLFSQDAE